MSNACGIAFSRLSGMLRTRRAMLRTLVGSAMLPVALDTMAGEAAKGKRARKHRRRGKRRDGGVMRVQGKPDVIGPVTDSGLAAGFADCGEFMVDDRFELTFTLRLLSDKHGNLVRGVETVSGTDTFINATSGKEIAAPFHNHVLIDFTTDPPLGSNTGVIYKVTVPGAGAVFLDVGRIVTNQAGDIIDFRAGPHQAFDGDFGGLCAALA
jgi:hypothetical protein